MSLPTGRMTELEAVNRMLRTIGEFQTESLTAPEREDVQRAIDELRSHTRDIQASGWWFNTEEAIRLPVDGDTKIPIPSHFSRADPTDRFKNYVQRGAFFYDKENHTDVGFTEAIEVDAIIRLPFDDLPHEAQLLILLVAGRAFQEAELGEVVESRFSLEALQRAREALDEAELTNADFNMIESPDLQELLRR